MMQEPTVDYTLSDINKILIFIRKNYKKLVDTNDQEAFKSMLKSLETAKTMANDARRRVCLMDAATKYANQLAFRMFVEGSLDENTVEIFRSFDTVKTVSSATAEYADYDKARVDAITKAQQDYMSERKPFEIFQAVIGGMSEEEAKQKQAEYEERKAQALGAK